MTEAAGLWRREEKSRDGQKGPVLTSLCDGRQVTREAANPCKGLDRFKSRTALLAPLNPGSQRADDAMIARIAGNVYMGTWEPADRSWRTEMSRDHR